MAGAACFGLLGAAIAGAVAFGLRERAAPARCPSGLVSSGPRCCAPGQRLEGGHCTGAPQSCPEPLEALPGGCSAPSCRVRIPAGSVTVQADDWESAGQIPPRTFAIDAFAIDAFEVTEARWAAGAPRGGCPPRAAPEPGRPVTGVAPTEATDYCLSEGGRLPTSAEFWLAARGPEGRRFPWGATGLVCRRVAYGLVDGPCGTGIDGPEIAGARPDGATPEGVLDLAGNVAEWTREASGEVVARGGSFRSRVAAELMPLGSRRTGAADDVGFRCVYPP
jgi:formylglycine-generating enzyme